MKRLGLLFAVVGLAGSALTTADAGTDANRTICHRTSSTAKPYVRFSVSAKQLLAISSTPPTSSRPRREAARARC